MNWNQAGEGTAAAEALAEAQAAKGVAERQTRLAEQVGVIMEGWWMCCVFQCELPCLKLTVRPCK